MRVICFRSGLSCRHFCAPWLLAVGNHYYSKHYSVSVRDMRASAGLQLLVKCLNARTSCDQLLQQARLAGCSGLGTMQPMHTLGRSAWSTFSLCQTHQASTSVIRRHNGLASQQSSLASQQMAETAAQSSSARQRQVHRHCSEDLRIV